MRMYFPFLFTLRALSNNFSSFLKINIPLQPDRTFEPSSDLRLSHHGICRNTDIKCQFIYIQAHQTIVSYRPGEDFCEFQKEFGQDVGITLCGELDDEEHFEAAYYFPYFEGSGVTTYAEIDVQCEDQTDSNLGILTKTNILFFLNLSLHIDFCFRSIKMSNRFK